jgi:wyosine [tRNA(Phe)-imidazoG37] synthetase (radical SAM superfamily)
MPGHDREAATSVVSETLPPRFDFIAKLARFPQRVDAVRRRDLPRAVSTIYLDVNTDICNHRCTFCDGFYRDLRARSFPWPRLERLFAEMEELGVLAVVLAGDRGEPMLHPQIHRILERLAQSSMRFGIYTNGTTPWIELIRLLGAAAWVRLSADAATPATHRAMHVYPAGRPDFERLLTNLHILADTGTEVGISFILDPVNHQEIAAAADLFLDAGAHFIEYKPKYLPNYVLDVDWLRAVADPLRRQLDSARHRWGQRVQMNTQILALLEPDGVVPPLTTPPRPCRTSLLRLVVSTHGCYTCTPYRGESERALGSIFESSLREIVDSAARRALLDHPCSRLCAYHAQNEALLALEAGRGDAFVTADRSAFDPQDYFI